MVDTRLLTVVSVSVIVGFLAFTGVYAVQEGRRTREFIRDHEIRSLGMAVHAGLYRTADRYQRAGEELLRDSFLRDWILDGEQDETELRAFLEDVRSLYEMMDASIVSDLSETYYGTDGRTLVLSPDNVERDGWYYLYRDSDIDTNIDAWYYPDTGIVGMWVNVTIRDRDGSFLGVTGGGVELDEFAATLHAFGRLPEVNVYLARRDGRFVYAANPLLLKAGSCVDSQWGIPVGDLLAEIPIGESWTVLDSGGLTSPLLFVGFSGTWDTFIILEKTGAMVADRMRATALNSLAAGGVLALAFSLVTLLIVRAARIRIRRQAKRLEELAGQDMLTGLDNRLRFTEIVGQELARIRRTGEQSSLILMDLDHFKVVNDSFGHPVGDSVLVAAAEVIRSSVRDTDHVSRFGGEEFMILLPGTSTERACIVAEKIRNALNDCRPAPPADVFSITASFGVAPLACTDLDHTHNVGPMDVAPCVDHAYHEADRALYRAKNNGRNRVELAVGETV